MKNCKACGGPVAMRFFSVWDEPQTEENPVGRAMGSCSALVHTLAQEVVEAAVALFRDDGRLAGSGHLPTLKESVARLREELERQ